MRIIPETIPPVSICYLPDSEGEGRVADELLEEWACQLVRRAVNQWLYSTEGADNDKG